MNGMSSLAAAFLTPPLVVPTKKNAFNGSPTTVDQPTLWATTKLHDELDDQSGRNNQLQEPKPQSSSLPSCYSLCATLGVSPASNTMVKPSCPRPLVVGHRGALYEELENTLPAFLQCVEYGCDAVELDVFLLQDGNLVVFHGGGTDENPGDLTDYCVRPNYPSILDCETFLDTQDFVWNPEFAEFGCPKDKLVGAQIPLLRDVLLAIQERTKTMKIKIELKGPGVTEPVLELVQELGMENQCQYSSFDHSRIAKVRELHPERDQEGKHIYQTGALFGLVHDVDTVIAQSQKVGADEVHLKYDTCTKDTIERIHRAGMSTMAWFRGPIGMVEDTTDLYHDVGNEDEAMYRVVMDSGVQQLCCNKPGELMRFLDKLDFDS